MRFGRRQHQVEQRIVGDLGGEAVFAGTQAEYHGIVGLEALRAMHGPVGKAKSRISLGQTAHVLGPQVSVSAQQQDAGGSVVPAGILCNPVKRLHQ